MITGHDRDAHAPVGRRELDLHRGGHRLEGPAAVFVGEADGASYGDARGDTDHDAWFGAERVVIAVFGPFQTAEGDTGPERRDGGILNDKEFLAVVGLGARNGRGDGGGEDK